MCTSIPVYPQMLLCIQFFHRTDDKFATKKGAVIFGQKCISLVSSGSAAGHLS